MEWAIAAAGFLTVVVLTVGVAQAVAEARAAAADVEFRDNALMASPAGPLLRFLVVATRNRFGAMKEGLARKLLLAGKPGGDVGGDEFLALALLAGAAFFLVMGGLGVMAAGPSPVVIVFALMMGGIGFGVVLSWLDGRVAERRTALSRQFPYFLDLAVMTMEAGSTIQESMDIYARNNPDQALAEELRVILGEMGMGKTFRQAMEAFHDRITVEQVQGIVRALLQGQRLGTPLGRVLRDQANDVRFLRTQTAERLAEELKVKIVGPSILMMMAVFILILGPVFVEVFEGGIF